MKRTLYLLVALMLISSQFVGCGVKEDKTESDYGDDKVYYYENDDDSKTEIEDNLIETDPPQKGFTKEQAIAILTEKGKIWGEAGIETNVGEWNQHYYVFIKEGDHLILECHTYDSVFTERTLSFDTSDTGELVLIEKGRDVYTSGTYYLSNDYWDSNSFKKWYIDEERIRFSSFQFYKTDY